MRTNKGQIWISAVLYMALGVIVLTIVLAAGVPMIEKMKDKNSFAQAKTVFFTLDDNIKNVINEGPGSRRYIAPFEVKAGEFKVDEENGFLVWSLKTKAKLMEPSYDFTQTALVDPPRIPLFQEGALYLFAQDTNIVDEYVVNLLLDYSTMANIIVDSPFTGPFSGTYSLTIEHSGTYNPPDAPVCPNCPVITLRVMP
ncbi:MAG TPA: hypothetical protein HA362_04375 [Nanoarchaeota archaeon]|nr:hypothetical protein [Nanoarchaeota archaeon]